ncbi:MAG: hypothetical protein CYPHOPRED_004640 [Cyphobasidiales sp. Tagirdzhanova-0007]|nr:MAG: hypothetical protein CYPHOPRED_004640 [Cyphobasidiales sp. Tagirdzhanova-0007]
MSAINNKRGGLASLPSPPASPELKPHQTFGPCASTGNSDIEANNGPDGIELLPVSAGPAARQSSRASDGSALDPLLLKAKLVGDEEIAVLRRRAAQKTGRGSKYGKRLGAFYDDQNEHILTLLKPLNKHAEDAMEAEEAGKLPVKIAIRLSLAANVCLAGLQLYAATSSLSLSFFATAIDSVFDPFANAALYWAHRKSIRSDPLKYPSGGSRLTTIGNIIYAFVMGSVSLILIVESIQALATHKGGDKNDFHVASTAAVATAFAVKLCLFLYCYSIRKMSSQVQVLWEDHRNDLLINGFGIFTNAAGAKFAWFLDPLGAIIISLVIISSWGWTAFSELFSCPFPPSPYYTEKEVHYKEEFQRLAGRSADPDFLRLVVYKAMIFSDSITAIDSCKAYHSGPNYVVEVDIVMPGDTPLWKAHDVSQDLQDQLETLPRVDRAYVHVDHEVSHQPEHRKRV